MKTTVTEEYEDGQLVRRTTVTEGEPATGGYVWPSGGSIYPGSKCTCVPGVTLPSLCPVHKPPTPWPGGTITVNTTTTSTPGEIAAEVGRQLRSMG